MGHPVPTTNAPARAWLPDFAQTKPDTELFKQGGISSSRLPAE